MRSLHRHAYASAALPRLPVQEYLPEITAACLIDAAQRMQTATSSIPGVLLNVGPATTPHAASLLPALVAACPTVTASASVPAVAASDSSPGSALVPDMDMATAAAEVIVALSQGTAGGEGNFNFAATANVKPGIPFFPAGFAPSAAPALAAASAGASAAEGESAPTAVSWAVGLEMPDVVVGALSTAAEEARSDLAGPSPWRQASKRLVTALESALLEVQAIATGLVAGAVGAEFSGIDASIAPAVDGPSLVEGFEALLGPGGFGGPGTLAACRLLTGAIEAVRARGAVSIVGYSGLMYVGTSTAPAARCSAQLAPPPPAQVASSRGHWSRGLHGRRGFHCGGLALVLVCVRAGTGHRACGGRYASASHCSSYCRYGGAGLQATQASLVPPVPSSWCGGGWSHILRESAHVRQLGLEPLSNAGDHRKYLPDTSARP